MRSERRFLASATRHRGTLLGVAAFSGIMNVLALTGSLYMLQVYDRVIPSKSLPTLIALTILMIGMFAIYGLLDWVRTTIMVRLGLRIDRVLRDPIYETVLAAPSHQSARDSLQPTRDLDTVRMFLSGAGPIALLDVPWIPVYLLLVYLLHPWLGLLTAIGGATLLVLALLTEVMSQRPVHEAARSGGERYRFLEMSRRNAEVIRAMGMATSVAQKWAKLNSGYLVHQASAATIVGGFTALTKVVRFTLQSAVLGLGGCR
jgi:ABC-type protease/lipase transport system fused ATPase/permease subunit